MEARTLKLSAEYIELNKLLKLESLVASGGAAKLAIGAGEVMVDGVEENRIRRKLYTGSKVEFAGVTIAIE